MTIRYLSGADIAALNVPQAALRAALARAFRLHAQGRVLAKPKLGLEAGPGHVFQSLCAASPEIGYAATKWVGVAAANSERGLPNVNGLAILSAFETGLPAAILDGNALTVLRTAALSGLAAEHLARQDSATIGFVGCGAQAHGHLDALADVLPALAACVCHSRSRASAERLAAAAGERGLDVRVTDDPDEAVACDVVVTSVPASAEHRPFLDPASLRPGSFVAAVDLGRSWHPAGLAALDLLVVDDRQQAADPSTRARLAWPGPFAADLAALVTGAVPGRTDPAQRAMFLFPGLALADLAVGAALLRLAEAAGIGLALPR